MIWPMLAAEHEGWGGKGGRGGGGGVCVGGGGGWGVRGGGGSDKALYPDSCPAVGLRNSVM